MNLEANIAVPYSVLFVMDKQYGDIPDTMSGQLVAATSSCIAIGTLPDSDGEVLVTLTNEKRDNISNGLSLAFNGVIATVSHEISVCTALNEAVISLRIGDEHCHVEVWVNDRNAPDIIEIVVS